MDEKLQAVLAQLKLAPGAKVHSARWQADGSARVLVDEGIGGVKVLEIPYREDAKALSSVEETPKAPFDVSKEPEAPIPDLTPQPPSLKGRGEEAEVPPEKRVVSKRSRSRK